MHCFRPRDHVLISLEAKMIVTMRLLRLPAWLHDVDLSRDAILRPKVAVADDLEPGVAEVGCEGCWVLECVFGEGLSEYQHASGS
jgi:hypothetical protein